MSCSFGRCIFGLEVYWAIRKPIHFHTLIANSNIGRKLTYFRKGNGWGCGVNTINSKDYHWKNKGIRKFEQESTSGWDVRWPSKGIRGYALTSTYSTFVGTRYPTEEDNKTTFLQAMDGKGDEDSHKDQLDQVAMLREIEQSLGSPLDSGPQVPPSKPLIIVISGPSGVGKDAVIKKLQEVRKGTHFVVTAATRAMRPGEVDGKDYYFVSKEEFRSMIEKNELLEYALVYGEYKGIPKKQIQDFMSKGYDIVLRVDVQGAATLRSILGNSALYIFLVAESEVSLVKRLIDRKTETMEKLLVRIATAREEIKRITEFDYAVVNAEGQLERSVNLILSIIDAEKARVQQRMVNI